MWLVEGAIRLLSRTAITPDREVKRPGAQEFLRHRSELTRVRMRVSGSLIARGASPGRASDGVCPSDSRSGRAAGATRIPPSSLARSALLARSSWSVRFRTCGEERPKPGAVGGATQW